MDIEVITQLISSLGFPILACIALGYYVKYITDKHAEETKEIRKEHETEVAELRRAVENNTDAVQRLNEHITNNDNLILRLLMERGMKSDNFTEGD